VSGQTVWLASYPKSGNTWFRAVFAACRRGDPMALDATDVIASLRARFDDAFGLYSSDLTDDEARALRPASDEVVDGDEPHLQKIHDGLYSGAHGGMIVSATATRCAIYLVRDPRDVAVSYAHHNDRDVRWGVEQICSATARIGPRPDDIVAHFPQRIGDWTSHVQAWVDRAPFPVHVVRYEDCLADPEAAFGDALAFAGFAIKTDDLRAAISAASFDRLQAHEQANGFIERFGSGPFFRAGVAGRWRAELTPQLVRRIEQTHATMMLRFGYALSGADVTRSNSAARTASA
jgi:aryl sulfotransferase